MSEKDKRGPNCLERDKIDRKKVKSFINEKKIQRGRELVRKWWKKLEKGSQKLKSQKKGQKESKICKKEQNRPNGDKMNQKAKNVWWTGLESFKKVYKWVSILSVNLIKASRCFKTFKMDQKELTMGINLFN